MLLLFGRIFAVYQVLKAGTSSSQSTFSALCLQDVSHRHMNAFIIGPVVAAEEVV